MWSVLWWRGLRSRPVVDLLLVLLSSLAVAMVVLGSLLVRAVQQSSVADILATEGVQGTSLGVLSYGDPGADLELLVSNTKAALGLVRSGAAAELWQPLQQWTETTIDVGWQGPRPTAGDEIYSRLRVANKCTDLTLSAGSCPSTAGQVALSTVDAAQHGVSVGDPVTYRLPGRVGAQTFTVVGIYDPGAVTTPLTRPGRETANTQVVTGDPLVVVEKQMIKLPVPTQVSVRMLLRQPVVLDDLPLLRTSVAELDEGVTILNLTLVVDTRLSDALARVSSQTSAAVVLVGVVEAQALGLALFAVVVVLSRLARARSAEWGAGRLLGISRRRWLRSIYIEPGSALLAGIPVGYASAVGIGWALVRSGLRPGTPFEPTRWPVLVAAGCAGLLLLLVLVAVSLPSLRRPLAELVAQRSEAGGTGPVAAAAQASVVLMAGFTSYVLLAGDVLGGRGPQVGLFAPVLFALTAAVLGVRLTVLVVRRGVRRPARSLVGLVVARQAARAPSSLSPAVVVTVGVALVVFAGQLLALTVRNQELKADAATGAASVLRVAAPVGTDLIAVVDRADPTGRLAMAVRERTVVGTTGVARVVAVDTSRLLAVSVWSPRWAGVADVAAALRPPISPPVELRGTRLDVRVGSFASAPYGEQPGSPEPLAPSLSVTLDTGPAWRTVTLGPVAREGLMSASIPCANSCRVVAVGLTSRPNQAYTATLRITGIGTDRQPLGDTFGGLTAAGAWHPRVGGYDSPDPDVSTETQPGPDGLEIKFIDRLGGRTPSVAPGDVVDPLPVLLGPQTEERAFAGMDSTAFGTGLDGSPQLIRVVGRAQVLPRALADGVLTDLRSAQDLINPQNESSSTEVWLAPNAPSGIVDALEASGLTVTGRDELTATTAEMLREPTTRSAAVAQTVALGAVLLTLLALVAARVVDAPRRRLDWRSLADAGLDARTLRRLCVVEIAVPALVGVVLGTISGVLAAVLGAARLPLVDLTTPGPPLALALDWPLVFVTALVSVFVVLLVAVVGAVLETHRIAVS